MAITCIPKEIAEQLKEGVRNGDFDIMKLMEMKESSQRRAVFEKYVKPDMARFINKNFEKAIASNKKNAMEQWAKDTFIGKDKSRLKSINEKIANLDEKGLLNNDKFLEDLVADKLGVTVTADEMAKIVELADGITEAAKKPKDSFGYSQEFFAAKKKMTDYINEINPSSNLKILTGVIGRGSLLGVKSIFTNIAGNIAQAIIERTSDRISSGRTQGLNNEFAKQFIKENTDLFVKTGFDTTRMYDISEDQQKIKGEEITHSQGKGAVRKVGRIYEDILYHKGLGVPDAFAASVHFADAVNLATTRIAKQEGLTGDKAAERALRIFKDAARLEPLTEIGQEARDIGMAAAFEGTYTDSNFISDASLAARNFVNKVTGDLRLGDLQIPFAKTPANVVARSLEASAIVAPLDTYRLVKAYKDGDKTMMKKAINGLAKAGVGLMGAYLLTLLIDPDDYIGEYEFATSAERELVEAKNATYNSIKIGDKYVSLDYFGGFAAPLVGMLNARKYGDGTGDRISKYVGGVVSQTAKIPGIGEVKEFLTDTYDVIKKVSKGDAGDVKELASDMIADGVDFVYTRLVPSMIGDIAAGIDEFNRDVASTSDKIKKRIPFLRQTLPVRMDMFGDPVPAPSLFNALLFGSRVRDGKTDPITFELNRLSDGGYLPSISDVKYTSSRVKELKEQLGQDEFSQMMKDFGRTFRDRTQTLINSDDYQKLSDEEKKDRINKVKTDTLDEITSGVKAKIFQSLSPEEQQTAYDALSDYQQSQVRKGLQNDAINKALEGDMSDRELKKLLEASYYTDKLSSGQQATVTKRLNEYKIKKTFGTENSVVNSILDANLNADKVEILLAAEKELSSNEFSYLLRKGRQLKLISNNVFKEYRKQSRS